MTDAPSWWDLANLGAAAASTVAAFLAWRATVQAVRAADLANSFTAAAGAREESRHRRRAAAVASAAVGDLDTVFASVLNYGCLVEAGLRGNVARVVAVAGTGAERIRMSIAREDVRELGPDVIEELSRAETECRAMQESEQLLSSATPEEQVGVAFACARALWNHGSAIWSGRVAAHRGTYEEYVAKARASVAPFARLARRGDS